MAMRLICAALLLLAVPAAADNATPPSDQPPDGLMAQDSLTGDWFGARKSLADDGLQLGGDEIFDALGNPAGGQKQGAAFAGRLELFATMDLNTAFGWKGAILHANAYQIHGHGLSADDIGNLLTVSNIGATPAARLFTLWAQQSLWNDTVSVRVGQIAADDEFFVSQYASLFLNSTFGWPSILGINLPDGGPAYPLATPGIRVKAALSPALVASVALFNGDPAPSGIGDPQARDAGGTDFRVNGGVFAIGELAYSSSIVLLGDSLPGSYKIGGWYQDARYADQRYDISGLSLASPLSSGMPALHRGDYGGYFIADQLLWRNAGTADTGLAGFFRLGVTPPERNLIELHADAGLSLTGLLPGRGSDVAGIGMSYEKVSSAQQGLTHDLDAFSGQVFPATDFESALEISYQAQLAPWWIVQPDVQLILHPGARIINVNAPVATAPGNAVVLGARTAISF